MLIVSDAQRSAEWYEQALGTTRFWDLSSVVALAVDGAPFFLHEAIPDNPSEADPVATGMTSARIELFVDHPDTIIARAMAAGATEVTAIKVRDAPWGKHRQGEFRDPFGHVWSVGDRSPIAPRTKDETSSETPPTS